MFDTPFYIPIILALTLPVIFVLLLGNQSSLARALSAMACLVLALRYIWWRYTYSMPTDQEWWQQGWAWIFFVFESSTILSSCLIYIFMSRRRDRSAEADRLAGSPLETRPVDVFIATYNEGKEILERTLVGATSLDHPDIRVWLLDDGARPWVEELAKEFGARYAKRHRGAHAKAGNVNNGLHLALAAEGRKPEFVLLLDADFIARKDLLRRALRLFEEPDVGIVQTPQHFFNPDPVQSNLLCTGSWPDEQRFFFNELLPCKDAWGAAFCCGTSAVFRVEALVKANGMATETVTEDMLTTFRLLEHGYRTVFLNERLSLGLAPEGLAEYIGQRSRWCLGAIQQIYTRWSFAGAARIGFANRLSCFDGILFWASGFIFKLMMITAPLVYWWTGTAVIISNVQDMLYWLAPYFAATLLFMRFFAGNRVFPVMTDVSHLVVAPTIARTVIVGLIKPRGHAFKVTAKGVSGNSVTIHWNFLAPFAGAAVLTVLGILWNMGPQSTLQGTPGFSVNVFWSIFNITLLAVACAVCVEPPRKRREERFSSNEAATLHPETGDPIACTAIDMSIGGARLQRADGAPWEGLPLRGRIHLVGGHDVVYRPIGTPGGDLTVAFEPTVQQRRALIAKLFTGAYNNEVRKVRIGSAFAAVFRKLFR